MSLVTLTPVLPAGESLRFHLVGQASLTGGVGGWEVVDRPKRRGVPEWAGVSPYEMVLPLLTDGFDVSPGVNVSVEPKMQALERLALKVPGGTQPPVVQVSGPIPLPLGGPAQAAQRWVVNGDLELGESVRRSDGARVQQYVTVTLLQYTEAEIVLSAAQAAVAVQTSPPPPGAPATAVATRTVTVRSGDTLSKIAAAELGDWRRFREIAALNGLRDPNSIRPGQVVRLP